MAKNYNYIGKSLPIHDVKDKVQGKMEYACDMNLHGMLHAKLILSSVASGKIKKIDVSKALAVKGVEKIYTFEDSPKVKYNSHKWFAGLNTVEDELLFTDKPKHIGDKIGAVLAKTKAIAEKAARLIEIEYETYPIITDPKEEQTKGNIAFDKTLQVGDYTMPIEGAIEYSDEIETQKVHHGAMETHVAVATPEKGGIITIWAPCQVAFQVRLLTAQILEMPLSKVRVVKSTMGGSFGGKGQPILEPVAAYLAKAANAPVKLVLNRQETIIASRCRNATTGHVRTKVTSDGKILGRDINVLVDAGAYYTNADAVVAAMGKKSFRMYDVPNQTFHGQSVLTNGPIGGACRGYGSPQIHAVTEIHMDRVAKKIDMDPIDLRLKNLVKPYAKDPFGGPDLGDARVIECVEKGRAAFKWDQRRRTTVTDNRYVKAVGMACATHGNGYFGAFQDYLSIHLRIDEDGHAHMNAGFHDQGCGTITTMQQIVAEVLDIPMDMIHIPEVDTASTLFDSSGTQASRVTYVCGKGAYETAMKVKESLLEKYARIRNVKIDDLSLQNGQIMLNDEQECTIGQGVIDIQNKLNLDVGETHKYQSRANPAVYAVNFAEVEIDKLTGLVRVTDVLAIQDIGQAINRGFVEGQVQGAIQMGIGYALTEELKIDKNGKVKEDSFAKYHVVNIPDMPRVEVMLVESPDAHGPFGAKSVGEISTCAIAPAIINAIEHGLDIEISAMPATPEKILSALSQKHK